MLALIDYGSGNLRSAHKALVVAGAKDVRVTADPDAIAQADQIVLPGVGAFADCIANLTARDGLRAALEQRVRKDGVPFLGICVGMQLMADQGIEFGATDGLGWIAGQTSVLVPGDPSLKVPHMGWNTAQPTGQSTVFEAWDQPQDVYFVHSFAYRPSHETQVAAWCNYGADRFAAAVIKDNMLGLQFHPEKSQRAGLMLLESWLKQ
jgi:imidazole glycerol-phosphate synthase subunit HisH